MEVSHTSAPDKEAGDYSVFPKQVSPNLYCNEKSLDSVCIASAFYEWGTISLFAFVP